jgi:transcriptional regulator GlxA family with amidase domain
MARPLMQALALDRVLVRPLAGFPGALGLRIMGSVQRPGVTGTLDRQEACLRALHEISAQLSGRVLKYGNRFGPVMQWAQDRMGPQMGVQAMAREAGLSRTHFSRLFTAETGMAPVEFLMETRLSKAKELLLNSGKRVKQIAAESGFFDAAHFSRQFRKMTGQTPGRFRREIPL